MKPTRAADAGELQRRAPVWLALSELYLDTELQEADYDRILETLRASNFSLEEIAAMHRYEICPLLHGNFISVAGEWVEFDRDPLLKNCAKFFSRRKNFWYRFSAAIAYFLIGREAWKPLRQRLLADVGFSTTARAE